MTRLRFVLVPVLLALGAKPVNKMHGRFVLRYCMKMYGIDVSADKMRRDAIKYIVKHKFRLKKIVDLSNLDVEDYNLYIFQKK